MEILGFFLMFFMVLILVTEVLEWRTRNEASSLHGLTY